eukprot:s4933_g2.t1
MIAYLQDHAVDASAPLVWRFPGGSLSGPGLWDFSGDTVSLQPSLSMASRMEEALNRLLQHAANHRIAQQDAGLPPVAYTTAPSLSPDSLAPRKTGVWCRSQTVDASNLVFGTDATGTTNDPRTRVVAVAVIACSLHDGALTEVGRITQVLPTGCNVVQGEAFALALLLKHTTGVAAVTADCKPAILQAQGAFFKNAHANIWDEVWEERHRLIITWHPSHRPAPEYQDRYGDSHHWRVRLNNLADQACREAAAEVSWRQHAAQVAQIDELAEEISHFLAGRAWAILAGEEAPPLDLKPRKAPRASLPGKAKAQQPTAPRPPQQQNRPGPDGGLNKKQRLELLMASEHIHGHRFVWSHTNPTNDSIKCEVCTLFIQQTHPPEIFSRLEAQPCAHKPLPEIGHFGLRHSFYCMGAVLLCTKCYAVHKPGQLTLTKATKEPCEGASRAHAKRRSLWAQKYLKETTAPVALFAAGGRASQTLEARKAEPTPDCPAQSRPIGESIASSQQRRAHIAASARFLANPVARVSRLRPLPAGHAAQSPAEGPARAKAGGRQSIAEATDAAHGGGPPSPTGDSYESSTEAAEEANPARPSTPTPWARRTASNNGSQECCTPGCAARLPGAGCP